VAKAELSSVEEAAFKRYPCASPGAREPLRTWGTNEILNSHGDADGKTCTLPHDEQDKGKAAAGSGSPRHGDHVGSGIELLVDLGSGAAMVVVLGNELSLGVEETETAVEARASTLAAKTEDTVSTRNE
jgi:hypothetical protein